MHGRQAMGWQCFQNQGRARGTPLPRGGGQGLDQLRTRVTAIEKDMLLGFGVLLQLAQRARCLALKRKDCIRRTISWCRLAGQICLSGSWMNLWADACVDALSRRSFCVKLAGMVASILSATGLLTLSVASLSASLDGPVTFNPLEVSRRSPAPEVADCCFGPFRV